MSLPRGVPEPSPACDVPSASRPRPRRFEVAALVGGAAALVVLAGGVLLTQRTPSFYRAAMASADADDGQTAGAARRLVSDVSALQAAFMREGPWEAAFSETDINAWLAADLPRNHAQLLPAVAADPRLRLESGRVEAGVRVGAGRASAVAWLSLEVRLRDPNQLGIVLEDARLGGLPLPRGPLLREIRRRFDQLGMVTAVRRLDGRSVLVVYIPSTHEAAGTSHWLESLAIGNGTIAFSGRTLQGRDRLPTQGSAP
jgi:hypothetical protein